MTNMTGSKLSIYSHPGKITSYWITTRSFPYRGPYCPGQYGLRLRPFRKICQAKNFPDSDPDLNSSSLVQFGLKFDYILNILQEGIC
jgi:hypothetical protein